jgi:hypothetical protein
MLVTIRVQNLLFSHPQPRNVKIKIHEIIILPLVLYGYVSRTKGRTQRVSENRVLRKFEPKRAE